MKPVLPSTRVLCAVCAVLLVISTAGIPASIGGVAPFFAELGLLLSGGALAWRATRRANGVELGIPMRVAAVALALIGAGQIARSKQAFPFMPYKMFGRAAESAAKLYEYHALHRSGVRSRFMPSNVFPTLGNGRIVKGLASRIDRITQLERSGQPAHREAEIVQQVVFVLAARYNLEHPADPVTQIQVVRVVLAPPFDPSEARRTRVMNIPVRQR